MERAINLWQLRCNENHINRISNGMEHDSSVPIITWTFVIFILRRIEYHKDQTNHKHFLVQKLIGWGRFLHLRSVNFWNFNSQSAYFNRKCPSNRRQIGLNILQSLGIRMIRMTEWRHCLSFKWLMCKNVTATWKLCNHTRSTSSVECNENKYQ